MIPQKAAPRTYPVREMSARIAKANFRKGTFGKPGESDGYWAMVIRSGVGYEMRVLCDDRILIHRAVCANVAEVMDQFERAHWMVNS